MSSKLSEKTSDVKVTVSSDSDDDTDTSSSSLLSSSAPSEDESDVETVTFSVPLPPPPPEGKGRPVEVLGDGKASPVNDSRKQGLSNKAVEIEKSDGASSRSSLSPNRAEVAATGTSSKALSGVSGLKKFARTDEPKVTMTTTTNAQRSISPKIVVNDVKTADAKTDAKKLAETSKKIRDNSPQKTVTETPNADLSCSASPANTLIHVDRSKSPQKAQSKVDTESSSMSAKKTACVTSSLDAGQRSPRNSPSRKTSEEIVVVVVGGNSKSFQGEKEAKRTQSPKKNSEDREISREKSPKNTSIIIDSKEVVGETSARNSSKETVQAEEKTILYRGATKTSGDLIRNEKSSYGNMSRLETAKEKPDTEEAKAKPKTTKTPKQEDVDAKDDTSSKSRADRTQVEESSKNSVLQNKGKTSLQYNGLAQDFNDGDNLGVRKTKNSEFNKPVESGNDVISLSTPDAGITDGAPLGQKTSKKSESGSDEVDTDTSSVSKNPNGPKTTENTKELVNEDSEFTYRRKSMDDFIKRILAEAREEKLKQQQGAKGEPTAASAAAASAAAEEEGDRKTEGYKEQNGGVFKETPGLPPKWSHGVAADKEASNLDKRLASIEKRRFGDNDSAKEGRLKVKEEGEEEEDSAVKKKPLQNDVNDFDMNLEDDLKEINRYLQSRKTTAASRFDYDDDDDDGGGLENESTASSTAGKQQRRWLLTDGGDQTTQPDADNALHTKSLPRKNLLDFDNDDDDDGDRGVLARIKRERERERDLVFPEALFTPRRRDVTDDVIRERTRSVRGLIDRQTDVVQTMKSSSKGLEDLDREIRAVRQVCLDRQARIEALDGALNAEFRAFETDHLAACERLNAAADFIAAPPRDDCGGRLRRQGRLPSLGSLNEDSFPFRRRSVCAPGAGGYGPASRPSDLEIDLPDLKPLRQQQQQQQRGSVSRGRADSESDYQLIDPRRRAGSVSRDWATADPSGLDEPGLNLLGQRSARTRASIATSNPTADYAAADDAAAAAASSDNFLARIRAKYSFLAPSVDNNSGHSGSTRSRGSASNYGTGSLLSTSDFNYARPRSGIEDTKLRSRDFLTTSSPQSYSPYTPSYYSVRDSRSPAGNGILGVMTTDRGRRTQSVADAFSLDRPTGSGTGSEFHSRFLDKVRGKKAMGEEAPASQDRPFKSRFLKGSPAESTASKPDRVTEGGGGTEAEGGERSEVTE